MLAQFQASNTTLNDESAVRTSFHYDTGEDITAATLQSKGDSGSISTWLTNYRAMLPTFYRLDRLVLSQVHDPNDPGDTILEYVKDISLAGTRTVDGLTPKELCAVMQLKTAIASRRTRGRFFAPPCSNKADVIGDNFDATTAYANAVGTFTNELMKSAASAGGSHWAGAWDGTDLCIYSRRELQTGGTADEAKEDVLTAVKVWRVHWLRSRFET
jgi:hypothetical protein